MKQVRMSWNERPSPKEGAGASDAIHVQSPVFANANDPNDRFSYDTDNGILRHDADGNGAIAKVVIAVLRSIPLPTEGEIFIV